MPLGSGVYRQWAGLKHHFLCKFDTEQYRPSSNLGSDYASGSNHKGQIASIIPAWFPILKFMSSDLRYSLP